MKIRHTAIPVKNMELAIEFYKILGFHLFYERWEKWKGNRVHVVKLKNGRNGILELIEGSWPIQHFALTVDCVEEASKKLQAQGAYLEAGKETSLVSVQFLTDPSGNLVELVEEK